ncbi:MAG: BtrH N-terminal domain-containing protein [Actinomycetota bacterium]
MRVMNDDLQFWFHDLCSCLQDCFGTLLLHHGHEPVTVLGASWEFFYAPMQARSEEFYYPAPRPTLGENLAPFHPIKAVWHESADPHRAWDDIKAVIARGRPVIAAVDNFYMPIRPAFGDVHAAHLVVVSGFDDDADEVYVLESTPPTFHGAIPVAEFLRARDSVNEARRVTRDYFFAGTAIRNRWIDVEMGEEFPPLTRPWVAGVIAENLRRFRSSDSADGWAGLDGLARYLDDVCERSRGPAAESALSELYTVGWASQSATALHADFLRVAARTLDCDELAEAGRHVDRLANDWTALRMFAAHASTSGTDVTARLRQRTRRFIAGHDETLELLEWSRHSLGRTATVASGSRAKL